MKDTKNIDRLFQEKFRDFEVEPPENTWIDLSHNLSTLPKKSNRPYWVWLSGIAAGLALLFSLNNPFADETNLIFKPFQHVNDDVVVEQSSEIEADSSFENDENITDFNPIQKNTKSDNAITNTNLNLFPKIESGLRFKFTKSFSKDIVYGVQKQFIDNKTNVVEKQDFVENEVVSNDVKPVEENNRWSVSTFAAPIFLSGFYNKDQTDAYYAENSEKQGGVSMSYGVQVAYKLSRKFSLQSGIHRVDYAFTSPNNNTTAVGVLSRISNSNISNLKQTEKSIYFLSDKANSKEGISDIKQVYGYIEIPIEAKYQLTNDGDFGVNVIGGFSTLLLNRNDIYIESQGVVNKLGEATDLNSLNFSGNLGVEFEYKVYKNVNFNLVPMFKIQTHTLNTENQYTPYSLGLYSGLNLRF